MCDFDTSQAASSCRPIQTGPLTIRAGTLISRVTNGWEIPPLCIGNPGGDFLVRGVISVAGLTANTATEAIYYTAVADGTGQPPTGAKRYTLTFTEPMPYLTPVAPGFWSVTMYDSLTKLTVPNPIGRYALGSSDNLRRNADGSFTLYVQHDDPGPEKRSNWLPALPGRFYLILRNDAPSSEATNALADRPHFVGPPPLVPA